MTNQEIKDNGLLIKNEQQIGGNTALRVGGVIEGIGYALDNKDAANGYYQATINGGSISVNAPNFVLGTSGNLRLKMPAAGTTASTLTIGNANAVQLWYNGAAVSSDNTWEADEIISVFYDGTRFMASNSQGGGGKAEKISYDNSLSGLAAKDVQGALDNIANNILHHTNGSFEQGGIYTGSDGSDNNQDNVKRIRIRSSYLRVKQGDVLYINGDGTQKVSIVSYDTNKGYNSSTGSTGWYSGNKYVVPQDGFIRLLVANQDETTNILVANLAFDFSLYPKNEYALKENSVTYDDIATEVKFIDLPVLRGYPLAGGTWNVPTSGTLPYHAILERTQDMKAFKLVASSSLKARYAFVTDYSIPATGDSCNFCNDTPVVTIDENKDSGWVKIPNDCKYIILIRQNAGVSYIPESIYVACDNTDYDVSKKTLLTSSDFAPGNLNAQGQNDSASKNYRIRSIAYFKVSKGDAIIVSFQAQRIQLWKYREDKSFIESTSWLFVRKYVCEFDGYVRFTVSTLNGSTNISPSSFAGLIYVPKTEGSAGGGGDEYDGLVQTVARAPRKGNYVTSKMLTLLFFSDIHLNRQTELKRIIDFNKKYDTFIDDILSGGDLQDRGFESDIAAFRELADYGAKNILQVIGNHDYYNSGANVWTYNTGANVYARFFAPFISNWDVTQPANAATNGNLYWYKDYTDNTSYNSNVSSIKVERKIRLIAIDTNNNGSSVDKFDATQNTWLQSVLADALTNGYHVIVASHYKPRVNYINCNFTDKTLQLSNDENYANNNAATTIQNFIDGGGKFICWLCGHEHNDYIGVTSVANTSQLVVGISLAQCGERVVYSVMDRIEGTKSQDLFNIVGFDLYNKHVRILRVGADFDIFMRSKKSLCINYETHDIIAQS